MPTLDTSDFNVSLAAFSLLICVFGLVSYLVKHRLYISETLVATLMGIIIGPYVTGWVDPRTWNEHHYSTSGAANALTYNVARVAVVIQVLFAGIGLPHKYIKIEARSVAVLLTSLTPGWLVCGLFIWWLIPGLTYMEGLAIAACLVPTDPVLVNSLTKGRFAEKHVDPAVRDLIVAESGGKDTSLAPSLLHHNSLPSSIVNDGLAFLFIYLPLYFFTANSEKHFPVSREIGGVIGHWIYETWIYEIVLAIVLGAILGYVARKSLRFAEERNWLDEDNFLTYGIGLAFFCIGFLGMLGTDDLLGAFVAGVAFSWDDRQRDLHEKENVHGTIDILVNGAIFVYIGAIMPIDTFGSHGPGAYVGAGLLVALTICILLFRRMPWICLVHRWIPALVNWRQGVFIGWFGPIGVSAIFFVSLLLHKLPPNRDRLQDVAEPVVFFVVLSSIIVHGVSIPAHHGIVCIWDGVEKRYFPKQWAAYQRHREARDQELKAQTAEEGNDNQDHEQEQTSSNGEQENQRHDGQQS